MVDFSPEIDALMIPIKDVLIAGTGAVQSVVETTVDAVAINTLDAQRNIKEAYLDTQANLFMTGSNIVSNIGNVAESTQRNLFSTMRDGESRFFSTVDSFLDRIIDLGVTIVSDVITILLIALIGTFGIMILYSAEIIDLVKHVISKLL